MKENLLEISGLHYSYDDGREALHVSRFSLRRGEQIAVLGANGAGKSTFFLSLNGVLHAHGKIVYEGKEITHRDRNELRRHIGIVFQDPDKQIIASTVSEEVSFGPMNLRLPREEVARRVRDALAYMNITEFRDRPPHYLSGGEKKRVSIADIIAMEPEIIVFDEPTVSLDPYNVGLFEALLEKLREAGRTVLISTHDVDFAYRWAERAVLLKDGGIEADGPVREVLQDRALLERCSLKPPLLTEVCTALRECGLLKNQCNSPRNVVELKQLLEVENV
ncbi:MAG: ABC transporter ATP-binding protein [Oscillospiraceae bacterium]|nr:ABC transporter ATP-binding protein [Oscillospiraceae bacterium]